MSFNSAGSFDHLDSSAQPFGDGYIGFDSAHQLGSSPNFADPIAESTVDESSIFTSQQPITESLYSPPSINTLTAEFAVDPAEFNSVTNGPILPEMIAEEGDALKLWRRENAARLEEKELLQKHLMEQILEEADVYKIEFHKKRQAASETNKVLNREKEKVFLASLEKFHVEADKDYWKSIAELVPKEVPVLEKNWKGNKPSISIMLGPKPGKPTDLSRMRQTLVKLKHDTPAHLKPLFHVTSSETVDDVVVDPVAGVEIFGQPIAAV